MKKQIIPIAVILVILLAGLALWFGLRGGGQAPANENARGITVFAPQDTEIIVIERVDSEDGSGMGAAEKYVVTNSEKYNLDLEPGDYTLLVSRGEGYYPWQKNIVVTEDIATEFYPILVPLETEIEAVSSEDEMFEEVSQAFSVPATLPTPENPKMNSDETAELYVEGSTISIGWLGEIADIPEFLCPGINVDECRLQPVFEFDDGTVENIEFYGEHNEIMILDRGNEIKVLEVDRRDPSNRNQQPIYRGVAPAFRIIDGDIYISDSGTFYRVAFDY